MAEEVDNRAGSQVVSDLLAAQARTLNQELGGTNVREHPHVAIWREAFRKLELNPNRFPSSIEALARRIAKKAELPSINKIVDLVNILSHKVSAYGARPRFCRGELNCAGWARVGFLFPGVKSQTVDGALSCR